MGSLIDITRQRDMHNRETIARMVDEPKARRRAMSRA